ncbi:MAG TPA: tRNA (N(6)-L-threonylcarbamoyladenosine(37)-C(2))-methylthiotransferase MtaB [Nitrospiraceae bacterium]|nr:tRNA (N(6)-L-threonylcarbamoyladenosine(37)-C(2))-methylthiotransferase MtaB [Nitrospiraceae bacterium]
MKTERPRASLHTLGCRLNQAETALLADRLRQDGYRIVDYGRPTDLLVINTCSVTDEAERVCRYEIRRTLRHSPQAFVAVTGCYAQTGVEALQRVPGIDLIVGNQHKMSLPAHLPAPASIKKQPAPSLLHTKTMTRDDFTMHGVGNYDSQRANLKIQDGCGFMCSFCLIPFARGHERSRRMDDTIREAEALIARGHRELILTGVNLGRYDQDGRSLLDLIQRLERIEGLDRIRISSIEPTTVSDALLEHMATSAKLCRHLHLPLQSGDDNILRAMNRRYTVRDYATFVDKAVRLIPDLGLGTDVLIGFPGEGEAQFSNTLAMATDLPFSYLHVFAYSKRPGTAAARMAGAVPATTIKSRSKTLADLSRAKRLAFYQHYVGRTVDVLFEAKDDAGRWTGLTNNYVRAGVTADIDLTNTFGRVVVEGTMDGLAVGRLVC